MADRDESPDQSAEAEISSESQSQVCQLARAQASIQAKMRPGVWLPGARNLHMSREVWEIKATPDKCLDKLVAAVDAIQQQELMEVSKVRKVPCMAGLHKISDSMHHSILPPASVIKNTRLHVCLHLY